jgi:hypothetical protein
MYIYTFLLGMTDTMTAENNDISSRDTLYISYGRTVFTIIRTFLMSEV